MTKTTKKYWKSLCYREGKIVVGQWRTNPYPVVKECEGLNCCQHIGDASDCALCPADIKRQCTPPNKPVPAFHCVGEWDDCKKHRGAGLGCPHVKTCREKTGGTIDADGQQAAAEARIRGRA